MKDNSRSVVGSAVVTDLVERCSHPSGDSVTRRVVERRSHAGSEVPNSGARSVVTGGHSGPWQVIEILPRARSPERRHDYTRGVGSRQTRVDVWREKK